MTSREHQYYMTCGILGCSRNAQYKLTGVHPKLISSNYYCDSHATSETHKYLTQSHSVQLVDLWEEHEQFFTDPDYVKPSVTPDTSIRHQGIISITPVEEVGQFRVICHMCGAEVIAVVYSEQHAIEISDQHYYRHCNFIKLEQDNIDPIHDLTKAQQATKEVNDTLIGWLSRLDERVQTLEANWSIFRSNQGGGS